MLIGVLVVMGVIVLMAWAVYCTEKTERVWWAANKSRLDGGKSALDGWLWERVWLCFFFGGQGRRILSALESLGDAESAEQKVEWHSEGEVH